MVHKIISIFVKVWLEIQLNKLNVIHQTCDSILMSRPRHCSSVCTEYRTETRLVTYKSLFDEIFSVGVKGKDNLYTFGGWVTLLRYCRTDPFTGTLTIVCVTTFGTGTVYRKICDPEVYLIIERQVDPVHIRILKDLCIKVTICITIIHPKFLCMKKGKE